MCCDACVPVCWRSRISSERTPISSECPQLKKRQRGHSGVERWCVCSLCVDVHCDLCHNRSHPTGKRRIIIIYKCSIYSPQLRVNAQTAAQPLLDRMDTITTPSNQCLSCSCCYLNWHFQRYPTLLSLTYCASSRSLNKQMSRIPRLEKKLSPTFILSHVFRIAWGKDLPQGLTSFRSFSTSSPTTPYSEGSEAPSIVSVGARQALEVCKSI